MNMLIGKCHCGSVSFEVATDLDSAYKCNCSYCVRRATTMHKVNASQFALLSGEANLGVYGSQDYSKHYFCRICGISCFTRITQPYDRSVEINIGCLEGINSYELQPAIFDGAKA